MPELACSTGAAHEPRVATGPRLQGKVILVTGAARGIGRECVLTMAGEGARVVVADVEEAARAVAHSAGNRAIFIPLDVTSPSHWERAVDEVERKWGCISVLVNNAGTLGRAPLSQTTEEMFQRVVDVNQTGVYLGMKYTAQSLERSGSGSIINISSVAGLRGAPNAFSYVAAKWAVRGMSQAAAAELGPKGIRVNTVFPGPIRTTMMEGATDQDFAHLPLGRMGSPAEIARAVLFLASDDSSYVSGAELAVDGGFTLTGPDRASTRPQTSPAPTGGGIGSRICEDSPPIKSQ